MHSFEDSTLRSIVAIVVTFNPDIEELQKLLVALVAQVESIVVVDNGSSTDLSGVVNQTGSGVVEVIYLGENRGIASAQNIGIQWASERGADYVLLMDQDSLPASDMVRLLLSAMLRLTDDGFRVAAVGPRFIDERNNKFPSFVQIRGWNVEKKSCQSRQEIVESDVLISSGCLISLNTFAEVGGLLDEFFIDQVDLEWCLRAKSHGYSLFGVCNAVLHHSLGEEPRNLLGRKYVSHGPLRHYYIFRNAIRLIPKGYTPVGWKLLYIRMIFVRFIVYSLFISPRRIYIKMMIKGVWHGLLGRMGKLD